MADVGGFDGELIFQVYDHERSGVHNFVRSLPLRIIIILFATDRRVSGDSTRVNDATIRVPNQAPEEVVQSYHAKQRRLRLQPSRINSSKGMSLKLFVSSLDFYLD